MPTLVECTDWERATAIYGEALGVCPKRHETRAALSANRAACYLKLEKYEDCVLDCTRGQQTDARVPYRLTASVCNAAHPILCG